MKALFLVGIGGGIGSILRYLISLFFHKTDGVSFPWATFIANIVGCLIIGLAIGYIEKMNVISQDLRLLFITGFCGGFTTFSTFSQEGLSLFQAGNVGTALIYILGSVLLGLTAVWIGMLVTR